MFNRSQKLAQASYFIDVLVLFINNIASFIEEKCCLASKDRDAQEDTKVN